ncbi:carcinoembryonic antigen-related cell adhesion molecule 15-like [Cricetulus griseus]|uniref:Carcinoembryonic antigen-related cell adhesion molecule 15-like n=1 Tax=Cricetulus griseus TaxID=10029 RepID=A0A9J7GJ58_CRIGR|nr:carcinoembryonic antigen-related cell adhesion molecule 15-like [Cricetulus griseus]
MGILLQSCTKQACWTSKAVAGPSIEAVPPSVPEGGNVFLRVENQAEKLQVFFWYKGKRAFEEFKIAHYETASQTLTRGRKYSGRETVYNNGSLLLQNVTLEDTGIYTLETFGAHYQCEIAHVHLQVYKKVTQPTIRVQSTIVKRQIAAVLTCVTADTGVDISWIFNNQPLGFNSRVTLSPEKRKLTIAPLRVQDAGEYLCAASNTFSSKKSNPVHLFVISA